MKKLSNEATYFLRTLVPFFMIFLCVFCPILGILTKEYLLVFAGFVFVIMFFFTGRFFWFINLVEIFASEEHQEFEIRTRKKVSRIAFNELKNVKVRGHGYFVTLTFTDRRIIFMPEKTGFFLHDLNDVIAYVKSKVKPKA